MHTFPQLRKIERKYGDKVVVIGVHSPKFPAERETANLREAVLRYRIEHPVVNDRDFQVWQRFGGRAWPTLIFIDPESRVIGKHEGELPFAQFDPLVERMLQDFEARGVLNPSASTIALEGIAEPAHILSFPGKVLACDDALYIADSNHHQIAEADLDGKIRRRFGSGQPALLDGPAELAALQQPQGMARAGTTLYVARHREPRDSGDRPRVRQGLDSGRYWSARLAARRRRSCPRDVVELTVGRRPLGPDVL